MPFAGFQDFDACVMDPQMTSRYPDEAARRRVCGALKQRLERRLEGGEAARMEASASVAATVEETDDFYLVRGVVLTRVGVNDQRLYKDEKAIRETAEALDGAPLVYAAHPKTIDGGVQIDVDASTAPGFAVNGRVEGDATVYDALLLKRGIPGVSPSMEDLARNEAFAAAVKRGDEVNNSPGYLAMESSVGGFAPLMGGGPVVRYDAKTSSIVRVGHVAILSPVAGSKRGSCPAPVCGALRGEQADYLSAAEALVGQGWSRGAALRHILRDA